MKRTIHIPDPVFEKAKVEAAKLGLSVSAWITQLIARNTNT